MVDADKRRWWNAYWDTWTFIRTLDLKGKRALVVGCGDGSDTIYLARLGAAVDAFDISPDMLAHGKNLAAEHNLTVTFKEAVAEAMPYEDRTFDLIYVRDILHHVDIAPTMKEISRVAKPGALMIVNEIYSHSITDKIRYSWLVTKIIYPLMRTFIYGNEKPYITEDERKMTEADIAMVRNVLTATRTKYFNFIVTRLVPDSIPLLNKIDRIIIAATGWVGRFLAGRIVMTGYIYPK